MTQSVQGTTADVWRRPRIPASGFRAAAWCAGILAVGLVLADAPDHAGAGGVAVETVAVALPVGFGLVRLSRAPRDRFAPLLVGAGVLWSLTTLATSESSALYSTGRVVAWLLEPALAYLILAFPSGRLETGRQRRLAAAVAATSLVLYVPTALLAPFPVPVPWAACGTACPANAFQLSAHAPALVEHGVQPLREGLAVVLFALVAVEVARRALGSPAVMRRVLAPVALVAGMRVLTLAVYFGARGAVRTSPVADAAGWLFMLSLPALTLAFAGGLVAHRLFAADALERLTRTLPAHPGARGLRFALAQALRDPSLRMLYWRAQEPSGWVEESGWASPPPDPGPGQTVTEVRRDGRPVAAIVHDAELALNPALLGGARAYVVAALDNQDLVHRLRSSLDELSQSRTRIMAAADRERRRIERDLHDGAQQRLVAMRIKLEMLAEELDDEAPKSAERLRALEDEIEATLEEVRRLGHGVYPPLLADRGLSDALRAAARTAVVPTTVDVRLRRRYPADVEAAIYFSCLEALQNAGKHARGATHVRITASEGGRIRFEVRDDGVGFDPATTPAGTGLTNIRDRLDALGGTLDIVSAPGKGTRVMGTIPVEAARPAAVAARSARAAAPSPTR
jgi:signal transduction histidine kinase